MPKFFGRGGRKGPEGEPQRGIEPKAPQPNQPASPEAPQNPITQLNSLANQLQTLSHSLTPGGEYSATREKFDQVFNSYTSLFLQLVMNPEVERLVISLHNPFRELFFDYNKDSILISSFNRFEFGFKTTEATYRGPVSFTIPLTPEWQQSIPLYRTPKENLNVVNLTFSTDKKRPGGWFIDPERDRIIERLNSIFPSDRHQGYVGFYHNHGLYNTAYAKKIAPMYKWLSLHDDYNRPLEANDLLKVYEYYFLSGDRPRKGPVLMEMFLKNTGDVIQELSAYFGGRMALMQEGIAKMSIPQIISTAANSGRPISTQEATGIAQSVVEAMPQTIPGVTTEQLRAVVVPIIQEYIASYEVHPRRRGRRDVQNMQKRIHEFAQGDKKVETLLGRFVKRVQDPERLLEVAIIGASVIPGAQRIAALAEIINVMIGPENEL